MTHTPLNEVNQACLIRSVLDNWHGKQCELYPDTHDSIFLKISNIAFVCENVNGGQVFSLDNNIIYFLLHLNLLIFQKLCREFFWSVPSSGLLWKHNSKMMLSISTVGVISMSACMSRTDHHMQARFTSSQRCVSSNAGHSKVLDQVLWRRITISLHRWIRIFVANIYT